MVSDIQKKDRESLSNDLNREKKIKTSHLLTLLPEKSCKETFLDAVTSRILVVWFSTSISLVPFLLPSFCTMFRCHKLNETHTSTRFDIGTQVQGRDDTNII